MKTRQLKFRDKEIREVLQKRGDIVKKGRKLNENREVLQKQIDEIDKDLNKLGLQLQQFEDKVRPWTTENIVPELGDTEDIQSVDISGEEIIVEIFDRVEDFRERLLEEKKKYKEMLEKTKKVIGKTSK